MENKFEEGSDTVRTAKNQKLMIFKNNMDIKIVDDYKKLIRKYYKINLLIIRYNVIHHILKINGKLREIKY